MRRHRLLLSLLVAAAVACGTDPEPDTRTSASPGSKPPPPPIPDSVPVRYPWIEGAWRWAGSHHFYAEPADWNPARSGVTYTYVFRADQTFELYEDGRLLQQTRWSIEREPDPEGEHDWLVFADTMEHGFHWGGATALVSEPHEDTLRLFDLGSEGPVHWFVRTRAPIPQRVRR